MGRGHLIGGTGCGIAIGDTNGGPVRGGTSGAFLTGVTPPMLTYLVLTDEIITLAQREKVDKMMREVQDYRMKPEEDIVQHLITVNRKMQKVLWKGYEMIRNNKLQYLTLRGTLIEREHQIILDELCNTSIPRTYWNLVINFAKFIISYGASKIARQKNFPDEDTGSKMEENVELNLSELAGMEQNEDLTTYDEEHGAQEPYVVAPISYVDSELTIRGIDMNDNKNINNKNINAYSVGNQMRRIMIHNNPGPHMSLIDPDAAHIVEFLEYPEILLTYQLAVNSEHEELLMWEIRKFVGPHTCTSTRMTEDHGKLDSKTICTFIMPMVKDMPTIKVLVLIVEMQMTIEQLYGDFDASYNELQ
ncbi:hypothetical protein GOBAR_AA36524 [Gossypium barbadense]|uniref:Uncharacterized protein n=1 Tax=Gossypium barbadense TaxID=3634 RepID=A0A2P5VZD5_GOSBA|nr:hypothetical protein GOBAR_AA36524 [Gossypium barbadense]